MAHTRSEMSDTHISLFRPSQIRLRDQNVAHGQHAEAAQFFGRIKHHGRESRGHFGVQTDFDTGLDLIFALDKQIQQFLGVNHGLAEIGHEADQGRVPLINDFGKGRGS